ncbi:hypothetical protein CRUP_020615 [Coryphaenoides rupestris]|nr:hypothetical protein CRUP_020615 [Coryphaenoides rupestris]
MLVVFLKKTNPHETTFPLIQHLGELPQRRGSGGLLVASSRQGVRGQEVSWSRPPGRGSGDRGSGVSMSGEVWSLQPRAQVTYLTERQTSGPRELNSSPTAENRLLFTALATWGRQTHQNPVGD